ncbi:MAG: tyrosine-type recombinase/integrase [Holophagales bacterium]|nr:tyrosine-type recombinase/integrase [Holophagales bacterium]
MSFIKQFFRWLAKENYLLSNPASELELPKVEKRLPRHVLTDSEAENDPRRSRTWKPQAPARPRASRDPSTRRESGGANCGLRVQDLDLERGTVTVRQGKGRKDRVIPIGSGPRRRSRVHPRGAARLCHRAGRRGCSSPAGRVSPSRRRPQSVVSRYVKASGVAKTGACHLFRHAMATLMLENGADIRFIQAMLGHVKLTTTEIYTHVAITKLKEIHTATHPAARLGPRKEEPDAGIPDSTEPVS